MAELNPIELQKALKGVNYPCDRDALVEQAKSNGADDGLVEALSQADADQFESPSDVQKAVFD